MPYFFEMLYGLSPLTTVCIFWEYNPENVIKLESKKIFLIIGYDKYVQKYCFKIKC